MARVIQWFPGHMAKAIRQFEENLHLVDVVFELVDARVPFSSRNPEVERIASKKPRVIILTKTDLADPDTTKKWLDYYHQQGIWTLTIDSKQNNVKKRVERFTNEKLNQAGITRKTDGVIKAICVGVPNVGKSTFLNALVQKKSAKVGNTPGFTKGLQWLSSSKNFQLLDTPGILWPKFQNQLIAQKLALTGAIKENIYSADDVALYAIKFWRSNHPEVLFGRYHLNQADLQLTDVDLLLKITEKIGMKDDYDRASTRIINDVQKGKLGRFTLDGLDEVGSEKA